MPKLKTHKGAARRFKITGGGKFTRRKGGISHNRTRMSKQARRQIDEMMVVSRPAQRVLRKLMPYAKGR
ncbi:MAG TPA: 50S ribosomal protein L35 [Dehalococcoidia bacterium]|jgi:large subunit ribosomal protein L35|nr:50S ribosomal protein L35 [Dehalococcoidia bacterium]